MAKGKHAASAHKRRAEAAHEHIDRLTDELVMAKERARRYEADHELVPVLQEALRVAKADLEACTSPELARLRELNERLRAERDQAIADKKDIREKWERATNKLKAAGDPRADFLLELFHLIQPEDDEPVGAIVDNRAQLKFDAKGVRRIQRAQRARFKPPPVIT